MLFALGDNLQLSNKLWEKVLKIHISNLKIKQMKVVKILIIVIGGIVILYINELIKGGKTLSPILAIPYIIFIRYVWKWKPKDKKDDDFKLNKD